MSTLRRGMRRTIAAASAAALLWAMPQTASASTQPDDAAAGAHAQTIANGPNPSQAQENGDYLGDRRIIDTEHTDAVSVRLDDDQATLFSKVDWPEELGAQEDPDDVVFHLTDAGRLPVPDDESLEFVKEHGDEQWLIPEVQNHDVLWAGWNTEAIRYDRLQDGEDITFTLDQQKSELPSETANLEVYQVPMGGPDRKFSSSDPDFASHEEAPAAHVHANWAFNEPGLYRLVFDVSVPLANGQTTTDERELAFVVGDDIEQYEDELNGGPTDDPSDDPSGDPSDDPSDDPTDGPTDDPSGDPSQSPTPTDDPSDPGQIDPEVSIAGVEDSYEVGDTATLEAEWDGEAPSGGNYSWQTLKKGDGAGDWNATGAGNDTYEFDIESAEFDELQVKTVYSMSDGETIESAPVTINVEGGDEDSGDPDEDSPTGGSDNGDNGGVDGGSGGGNSGGGSSGGGSGSAPVEYVCLPPDGSGSGGGGSGGGSGGGDGSGSGGNGGGGNGGGGSGDNDQGSEEDEAPAGDRIRVEEGHFDFGPRLRGGAIRAQVKDDREAPPVWRAPEDVTFVLTDASKKPVPAEFDFVAPEGSEVYMIGQVQEPGVPWLGWNTQDTELVNGANAVSMTLDSMSGPGDVNVFVGAGGFGGGDVKHVFQNTGDSYDIPMRTHEHGYWTFTEAGEYTMDITFTVTLGDGSTAQDSGTLHFEVGGGAQAGGEVFAGGSVEPDAAASPDMLGDDDDVPQAGGTVDVLAQPEDDGADDEDASEESADPSEQPQDQSGQDNVPSSSGGGSGSNVVELPADDPRCALPRTGAVGMTAAGAVGAGLLAVGGFALWFARKRRVTEGLDEA